MGETEVVDTAMTANARKRRMQRRAKQPAEDDAEDKKKKQRMDDDASFSSNDESLSLSGTLSKDDLAKIPGVKQQARYVPAVPMTKTELTLWRKEARRLRNRESAAASRQKTQGRIVELEAEVGALTTKYQAALRRIVELEAQVAARDVESSAWKPPKMTKAQHPSSPLLEPHPVSPPLSPRESFSGPQDAPVLLTPQSIAATMSSQPYPHYHTTTCKISRPNAVKITPVNVDNVDTTTTTLISRAMTVSPQDDNDNDGNSWVPRWTATMDDVAPPPPMDSMATTTFMLPDAALAVAAEAALNDVPIEVDDMELGDFLRDTMSAEEAERHSDALYIFEELCPMTTL